MEPGQRVGAVSHSDGEVIFLFGYGVFLGNVIPDKPVGFTKLVLGVDEWEDIVPVARSTMGSLAEGMTDEELIDAYRSPIPKIQLDNGKIVWGSECWWSDEDNIRRAIGDKKVEIVDIDERRENAQKNRKDRGDL